MSISRRFKLSELLVFILLNRVRQNAVLILVFLWLIARIFQAVAGDCRLAALNVFCRSISRPTCKLVNTPWTRFRPGSRVFVQPTVHVISSVQSQVSSAVPMAAVFQLILCEDLVLFSSTDLFCCRSIHYIILGGKLSFMQAISLGKSFSYRDLSMKTD